MVILVSACSTKPNMPDMEKEFIINSIHDFGIVNLTVIRIDPNSKNIKIIWRGYKQFHSGPFNPPFEEMEVIADNEKYFITNFHLGNNELSVNGKVYKFNSNNEVLLIKFSSGISVIPTTVKYWGTTHIYDKL